MWKESLSPNSSGRGLGWSHGRFLSKKVYHSLSLSHTQKRKEKKRKGKKVLCKEDFEAREARSNLSHHFSYDKIIYSTEENKVFNIKLIFQAFRMVSGHKINTCNSSLIRINVQYEEPSR